MFRRALDRFKSPLAVLGHVAHVAGFVGQKRRVRRKNAVLRRQRDQFVHQLLVAAFEIQLVDDLAHPPRRPQLGHEGVGVVIALFDQLGGEVERLFLVADFAAELHFGVAALSIAADQHDLVAGEQVELALRVDSANGRRRRRRLPRRPSTLTSVITGAPILRYSALTDASMSSFGRTYWLRPKLARASLSSSRLLTS